LLPGFPLDGGRVLRSIIWAITGNLEKATQFASLAGQGIGWLFVFTGLLMAFGLSLPFLGQGLFSGLWLVFIGWFLASLARQGYQQVILEDALKNVKVSSLMRSKFAVVSPKISVNELVNDHLLRTEDRVFVVMEADTFLGLVCLDDIKKIARNRWQFTKVGEMLTPSSQLEAVSPDEPVLAVLQKITSRDVNQLPVVENNKLIGLVSRSDILLWLQTHLDMDIDNE